VEPSPGSAPNSRASSRRSGRPPTATTRAPASFAAAQSEADRPGAEHGHRLAGPHLGALDPVQAAGKRLHQRRDLGREPRRGGEEVALGDPGRDEQVLGVGAVQERAQVLAERLLTAPARRALAARGRVGCDDAAARGDVDPAELVAERARHLRQEQRVATAEGLRVGAVRERDLDLHEDVARPRLGPRHLLDPEVAGPW